MKAHYRDKTIALLKSVAAPCNTKRGAEYSWQRCRHCLAIAELEFDDVRAQLAEFIRDTETRSPGETS